MNSIGLLAAADAGGKASNPILPVWNEIIWGGAAFAILFIVMAKFAYPAIQKVMEARSEKIQGDLDAADTARSEAEGLRAESVSYTHLRAHETLR